MVRVNRSGWGLALGVCSLAWAGAVARAQDGAASLLSPAPVAAIPTPIVPPVPAPVMTAPVPTPTLAPTSAAPAAGTGAALSGSAATAPTAPAAPVPLVQAKPHKPAPPPAPPRETAISTDPTPTLTPETFFATAKASERYASIADAGGWPAIAAPLAPGAKGAAVATLRLRLAIEGLLDSQGEAAKSARVSPIDTRWTPDLTTAVKRFQALHGLKDSGAVTGATLKAMNVPANVRFTELASSAQRLAGREFAFSDRYVVVNIPSAVVETVENGQVFKRYVAVVGDPDHPSPEVDAKVVAVNLNPTWTVPVSIIKNEIIPKMQTDPGYLAREKIRILDNQGNTVNPRSVDWTSQRAVNYTLRQDSGTANALGSIRINMPNKYAVYMHDTPSKRFFGADMRFLSHGCVRVQGVYDLAAWLLQGTPGAPEGVWTRDAVSASIEGGEHKEVKLSQPVPVAWVYLTGWATANGDVHFRDDVYGLDTIGAPAEARADLEAMTRDEPLVTQQVGPAPLPVQAGM